MCRYKLQKWSCRPQFALIWSINCNIVIHLASSKRFVLEDVKMYFFSNLDLSKKLNNFELTCELCSQTPKNKIQQNEFKFCQALEVAHNSLLLSVGLPLYTFLYIGNGMFYVKTKVKMFCGEEKLSNVTINIDQLYRTDNFFCPEIAM